MCLWASSLASLGIYFLATTFSQLQIGIILTASRRWFFQSLILAHGLCSQSIIIMIIITIIHCGKEWQAYIRKALLSPCPILHCFYPWLCIYSWRKSALFHSWECDILSDLEAVATTPAWSSAAWAGSQGGVHPCKQPPFPFVSSFLLTTNGKHPLCLLPSLETILREYGGP